MHLLRRPAYRTLCSRQAVLCCAVLCCAVLCCAVLCCAVLCCAVLCCAVLCCAVLCCAVLCCAVLCCAVLCCAALRCMYERMLFHLVLDVNCHCRHLIIEEVVSGGSMCHSKEIPSFAACSPVGELELGPRQERPLALQSTSICQLHQHQQATSKGLCK